MKRIYGIKNLMVYLDSINHPLSEEMIITLISKKTLPHRRPVKDMYLFDTDHIDWWVQKEKTKE
ncbi:hypothetical protein [Jeotgalibacillus proteolyticus]|uniref:Uncharacterized protein n=1 Tax=Jeotgalibacillus proteolyticus TaxID=2082395 RepID=A0A2S5GE34_9BACL|nr:hypothetical protein [Jeotgalibacillus proteolyticus]PPA71175.1 hypothetical protein C4B60_03655 [Jeotgalibacillus proteolyticus]